MNLVRQYAPEATTIDAIGMLRDLGLSTWVYNKIRLSMVTAYRPGMTHAVTITDKYIIITNGSSDNKGEEAAANMIQILDALNAGDTTEQITKRFKSGIHLFKELNKDDTNLAAIILDSIKHNQRAPSQEPIMTKGYIEYGKRKTWNIKIPA